jgi:hypothetical protein
MFRAESVAEPKISIFIGSSITPTSIGRISVFVARASRWRDPDRIATVR